MSLSASSRIETVDALRGVALFGILVVNIQFFASSYQSQGLLDPRFDGPFSLATRFLTALAFEGKFYLLFSFLFGYSFTLQASAAARDGASLVTRSQRRLGLLWVIGALHAALLFYGDILTTYAVLGFVLLAWRQKADRQLARTALWLMVLTTLLWCGVAALVHGPSLKADLSAIHAESARIVAAYTASPASALRQNLSDLPLMAMALFSVQAPMTLAMFCLGLLAGRHQLLSDPSRHAALLHRVRWIGLAIGLPGALATAYVSVFTPAVMTGLAIGLATAPFLTAAYIAWALRIFEGPRGQTWRRALAPVGRMALSHYLMQSVVLAFVFYGYGLGLMGQLAPPAVLGVAIGLFALQMGISRWWLRRFAHGWLEGLLRAVTRSGDTARPGR